MGWRSFLKQQLREGKGAPKALLFGGGSTELELTKHFRLVRKLGKGSYATVYEAERLTDGQRYALKVTDLHSLSQLDKAAVVEEIRLLASLDHPNLVSYFEAFCDHDQLCVVQELVMGGDLGTFLSKMRQEEDFLWERQVWSYFLQAALGVQYLHHNHVLHRDLKPQNIMLTKKNGSGLLKIVDLGVSAELGRVFTRVQIGTPQYMAPEMWERKAYSYSADIWALGCILHELTTLRPTFLSEAERTEADVRRRVLAGTYTPVPTRYSMDVTRLVGLMLQKDPKERPTIDEILAMPSVRDKFVHLPPELQGAAAAGGARDDRAQMQALLQLPDDSRAFNCMLPPARYATGPGVAELMCGRLQRRSLSLSDLHAAGAGSGSASPLRPPSPPPGGPHPAGSSQAESGGRGGLRRSESESRLRRRSIMVGEVLFSLQQGPGEEAAGGTGAAGASAPGDRTDPWLRGSLGGPAPAGRQHAATPLARLSLQQADSAEWGEGINLQGGMASGPAARAADAGAAGAEGRERGRPQLQGIQRRSVTVAEVLHYEESKLKKQLEGKPDKETIAELAGKLPPLAREPFEFCAQGTAAEQPAGGSGSTAARNADAPARPAAGAPQHSAAPAQLAGGDAAAATGPIAGKAAAAPVSPHAPAAAPPAPKEEERKKKKKGRLWRLMYGDESGSGMHQPADVL